MVVTTTRDCPYDHTEPPCKACDFNKLWQEIDDWACSHLRGLRKK
jgi:hypothetical protein